jgi:REP element-mobilizing transposase RayT
VGRSRYKIYEEEYSYFVTSSIVEGLPLFMDPKLCSIILDSLTYAQQVNNLLLYGYVIMPNHIHLIIKGEHLSKGLRAFKSYTARCIVNYLEDNHKTRLLKQLRSWKLDHHKDSSYQVWQEGFHPKQISTPEMMEQKLNYIHFNPVKSGFVESPLDWRYSSASNYEGTKGLISITLYDL